MTRKIFLGMVAGFIVLCLGLAGPAAALEQQFFGEDLGLGEASPRSTHPNADKARDEFLSKLTGVGTETFEEFAAGTAAPLALVFPGAGTATLQGSGSIVSVPAGQTNGVGRYAISGTNFWENTIEFYIEFSEPIAAFGFYGVDVGDFSGQLTLEYANGEVTTVTIPHTINAPGGTIIYFGYINTDKPFIKATFGNTAPGVDYFAFDDMTIGSPGQVYSLDVPLYLQNRNFPAVGWYWKDETLGFGPTTIGGYGCGLTSLVMIARSYGISKIEDGDGNQVDLNPFTLNEWMKDPSHIGLKDDLIADWSIIEKFTQGGVLIEPKAVPLDKELLENHHPVIIKESYTNSKGVHTHFVVARGKIESDYLVNDPYVWKPDIIASTLQESCVHFGATKWVPFKRYKQGNGVIPPRLIFNIYSPAEIMVVDQNGRATGYNPNNGQILTEIPDSSYEEDGGITDPEMPDSSMHTFRNLFIPDPIDGTYQITVIGTGMGGPYMLEARARDTNGVDTIQEVTGVVEPGTINQYYLTNYTSDDSSSMLITQDSDNDGVLDNIDNCPHRANPDQKDSDGDGVGDACDGCLSDPLKTAPGVCGCGIADTDSDGDGVPDCIDKCPNDPKKTDPGICGCGVADTDSDGDEVPDCKDHSPTSNLSAIIVVGSCDTGVKNKLFADGCTMSDQIGQCAAGAKNHGGFVSCVAHLTNDWKAQGLIKDKEKGEIQSCAANATN